MILDNEQTYFPKTTVLPNATTALSLVIDHGAGAAAVGPVNADFTVFCQVTADAVGGGSNVVCRLQQDTVEAFGSPTEVILGSTVVLADAVAGKTLLFVRQPEITQRYSRLSVTGTGAFTAGNMYGGIVGSSFQRGEPTA